MKDDIQILIEIGDKLRSELGREPTLKEALSEYNKQMQEIADDMLADAYIEEEKAFPTGWCDADIY